MEPRMIGNSALKVSAVGLIALLFVGCITLMTACGNSETEHETTGSSETPQIMVPEPEEPQEKAEPMQEELSEMRVR